MVVSLVARSVTTAFGGITAVNSVSFEIAAGELVGLVGPNGSGKTTLLNILGGQLTPDSGAVTLDGKRIEGLAPERIAHHGLLRMFQHTRIFPRISALDNLLVAGRALGLGPQAALRKAEQLLDELRLREVMELDGANLSGGQQKLLEFGTCFMVPPHIALLDEPFAGVHVTMKQIMADVIRRRHAAGQTFLIVSHDMPVILELCPRSICMNAGSVIADEDTRSVLSDPRVMEAYLGGATV